MSEMTFWDLCLPDIRMCFWYCLVLWHHEISFGMCFGVEVLSVSQHHFVFCSLVLLQKQSS